LGLDIEPPKCIKQCRFSIHRCGGNGAKWANNAKPVVETRVKIPGIEDLEQVIFLSRAMLLWLYHYDVPMIFRPGKDNDYIMHHKNRNPFDDRPENIVVIHKGDHIKLHANLRRIDNAITTLEASIRTSPDDLNLKKLLDQQVRLRNSIMEQIENDPAVFKLIEETVNAI
jgi:hypothetical protein